MADESRRNFLFVAGAGVASGLALPMVAAYASGPHKQREGKQYAMVVDVAKCLREEGCTKCIDACHKGAEGHNVPDLTDARFNGYKFSKADIKRLELKWIWKERYEGAFPDEQHAYTQPGLRDKDILMLCNHCESPACVRVCPTQATWKRESDGLVMMDMHRCIGCRYCIVGCPYGARSFNFVAPWPRPFEQGGTPPNLRYPTRMRGVVEKCTFCAERQAAHQRGERSSDVPLCVEACPVRALTFGNVYDEHSEVRQLLASRYTIRRKPGLGTEPQVYYIV